MGDTGYQLTHTADGRSDKRLVPFRGVRVPGVTVYDSDAVLFIPRPAAFDFGDKTRSDAAEEINSLAVQGCAAPLGAIPPPPSGQKDGLSASPARSGTTV
jgi:hypothetical protein